MLLLFALACTGTPATAPAPTLPETTPTPAPADAPAAPGTGTPSSPATAPQAPNPTPALTPEAGAARDAKEARREKELLIQLLSTPSEPDPGSGTAQDLWTEADKTAESLRQIDMATGAAGAADGKADAGAGGR